MSMREYGKAKCVKILCKRVSEGRAGEKEEEKKLFPPLMECVGGYKWGGEEEKWDYYRGENWVDFLCVVWWETRWWVRCREMDLSLI